MADRVVRNLEQERRAAEALRETLAKLPEIDEGTLRDTIEGETGLHEAIADVVATMTETEVMIEGLGATIKAFAARLKRYEDRRDFLRAAIEQAMVVGELSRLELPGCTLSLGKRAPALIVIDEAQLPAAYWKQPEPVVDKAALKAALKAGDDVPGAALGNGSVSLTVRRA